MRFPFSVNINVSLSTLKHSHPQLGHVTIVWHKTQGSKRKIKVLYRKFPIEFVV